MFEMEQGSLKILGACPPDLKESTIDIRLQDGFVSRTTVIRPVSKTSSPAAGVEAGAEKLPLIILTHGGSFMVCSSNMLISPARAFASHFRAVVACISYKLAPEHPFPAPVQSAWEVTAWLSAPENLNAILKDEGLGCDPKLGFILGGCSAGANISAAIAGIDSTVRAGHNTELVQGLPEIGAKITGLFISIPYLMETEIVPAQYLPLFRSRIEHPDNPILNTQSIRDVAILYQQDIRSPWFSPLNLDLSEIQDHHPQKVYVHCGDLDILRDDAVIYERILKDTGIADTRIDVLQDYHHACWCNLLVDMAHTTEMKELTMNGMGWLLSMKWDRSKPLSH